MTNYRHLAAKLAAVLAYPPTDEQLPTTYASAHQA